MTFEELKRIVWGYKPIVILEATFPYKVRAVFKKIYSIATIVCLAFVFAKPFIEYQGTAFSSLFIIFLILTISQYLWDAFFYSYYFKPIALPFELGAAIIRTEDRDILAAFLSSKTGKKVLQRCGIDDKPLKQFLAKRTHVPSASFDINPSDLTAETLLAALVRKDSALQAFLFAHGLTEADFVNVCTWVLRQERKRYQIKRWWSRERLTRVSSIGSDWSYGQTYNLERYGHFADSEPLFNSIGDRWKLYMQDLEALERILIKRQGANVLLLADEHFDTLQTIVALAKMIATGAVTPELEHVRLYILNTDKLVESAKNKADFESLVVSLLNEAARVGNIIVVFENISSLAEGVHSIGADIATLLETYLASSNLQIIGLSNTLQFNQTLQTHHSMMTHFEKIFVKTLDGNSLERLLQDSVYGVEHKYKIIFTISAIKAIVESAQRYFSDKGLQDAVFDLFYELIPEIIHKGDKFVERSDIDKLVADKTGIPQGEVTAEEHSKLDNLEDILHKRVIGQNEAIVAISQALRRARAGISDAKRPTGSFLFVGPTGVGKTETTKALAEAFFGGEESIMRLDMSEYSSADAAEKLIGSFSTNTTGVLSAMLKEKQYGVLLLDEFEKTNPKVLDIFLQILDEGVFSDGRGEKINARNLIIIATSNAGSDVMYDSIRNTGAMSLTKDYLIHVIIDQKIFKPELVNRFDGVILFHPLAKEHLISVATLILKKLNDRLKPKGIRLEITTALLESLVRSGADPVFGARAMNRVIKEKVENVVAMGVLDGKLYGGITFELEPQGDEFLVKIR